MRVQVEIQGRKDYCQGVCVDVKSCKVCERKTEEDRIMQAFYAAQGVGRGHRVSEASGVGSKGRKKERKAGRAACINMMVGAMLNGRRVLAQEMLDALCDIIGERSAVREWNKYHNRINPVWRVNRYN